MRRACLIAALALAAAGASTPDIRPLTGPIADFWPRVKLDWNRRIPGLNFGPGQTFIWVAMVWDGPDDLDLEGIVDDLQQREAGRWVRSQITKHRWSEISDRSNLEGMQALKHNLILVGTPDGNDLVRRALESVPLKVTRGGVSTGLTDLTGEDLLVVAIAPSPMEPDRYALVITASSPVALLDAGSIPYGETDYIIFRGRKVLERGFFDWADGVPRRDHVVRPETFTQHFDWRRLDSRHFTLHYDPTSAREDEVGRIGRGLDEDLEETAAFLAIERGGIDRIDCWLYTSMDEKVRQTGDTRPAHIERGSQGIHVVHGEGYGPIDPSLAARVLISRASRSWGKGGARELPGLAFALGLAAREDFQGMSLDEWAARSTRDDGYLPMDLLLARRPEDLESGDLAALDAAAFVRRLIREEGPEPVARFYRTARRSDFHRKFRAIFGRSIREAEKSWLESLPDPPGRAQAPEVAGGGGPPIRERGMDAATDALRRRDNTEAERLLLTLAPTAEARTALARVYFRTGRFEQAAATAQEALAAEGGGAETRAWARLTLARAEAMRGRTIAAIAGLRGREIEEGPEQVRIIAAYWMEKLGRPLNQREAHRVLMAEAEADLMNFKWEEAESKLRSLLAADPQNREAHAALGNVYLSKYQYWYDWILLDRELFPGISQADPLTYKFLADKGNQELRIAESLPSSSREDWLSAMPAHEPGTEEAAPHYLRGRLHFLKGDLAAARRELETALQLEGFDSTLAAYCRLYLGRIAALEGDPDTARGHFDAVVGMRLTAKLTSLAEEAIRNLDDGSGGTPR